MEPKLVTKDAFKVIGMQVVEKPEKADFPGLWDRFIKRSSEVEGALGTYYGVCECHGEAGLCYTAAVDVPSLDKIPADMVGFDVPGGRYAVFTHKGLLSTLGATYNHIYQVWMPTADVDRAERPEFELYDERFDPNSEESEMDIYIPVK
jgi:AraC family transcriptional regulator